MGMITLYSEARHTFVGVMAEGIPGLLDSLKALTNSVALGIIGQIAICLPLLRLHPQPFVIGFIYGFFKDQVIREAVEKVDTVFKAYRTLLERGLLCIGGGLLALLTMPTSTIMFTLYQAAQAGALLYQKSYIRCPSNPPSTPGTPRNGLAVSFSLAAG